MLSSEGPAGPPWLPNGRLPLVAQAEDAGRTGEDRHREVRLEDDLEHLAGLAPKDDAAEGRGLAGVEHHEVARLQLASCKVEALLRLALWVGHLHQVVRSHAQNCSARLQLHHLTGIADLRRLGHLQDGGIVSGHNLRPFLEVPAHQE